MIRRFLRFAMSSLTAWRKGTLQSDFFEEWEVFSQACQKKHHRTIGNWMARFITRPMALHITRVILPWGISAHAVTMTA